MHQVKHFSRTQHCLGWYASPIQADPAHVLALDDCHFLALLGASDRTHIAPGASADYDHVKGLARHDVLQSTRGLHAPAQTIRKFRIAIRKLP